MCPLNKKIIVLLSSVSSLSLVGCTNAVLNKKVDDSYNSNKAVINTNLKTPNGAQDFVINTGRFVDGSMHDLLPDWYNKPVEMHAYQVPLVNAMNVLTAGTQLKIVYDDQLKNTLINVNFKGTLHDALVHILHKNNLYFSVEGSDQNTLRWSATESKTFDIAFMPGDTSFSMGGSNSSGDNTNQNSASLKGNLSVWNDIQNTVKNLLTPTGKINISQSTSTVTVIDKPLAVEKIASFIDHYNQTLSQRVTLHIKILEVQLDQQHQFGIDWNLVYKGMSLGGMTGNAIQSLPGFAMNAGSQSNGMNAKTTNMKWAGTSLFINALDGQGKTSVVDEPTITTLNNTPSTLSITDKKAYIKSTEVTTTGSGGTATTQYSINPDNIETGLKMTLIPHIQGDKVYLSIDGSLSTLQGIDTKSFGQNGQSQYEVQLPETSSKDFNQRVMSYNNQMIVLSGLRTQSDSSNDNKNFGSRALGSNSDQHTVKELVILIDPEIVKV